VKSSWPCCTLPGQLPLVSLALGAVTAAGCKSWIPETNGPPQTVVPRVPVDPDRLSYNWVIDANGPPQIGGIAL
jgi:hypothetical protein